MWGLDRLESGQFAATRKRLRNGSCALLTHNAAVDRRGVGTLRALDSLGVTPRVVFTPEHGFDGAAQAEEAVPSPEPPSEGLRIVSLYGTSRDSLTPAAEHLEDIDTLVIDLVDVGSRYYTYVWTALLAARAAQARGVHTLVLDRPNPLGGVKETLEGRRQQEGFLSFVGLEPIAIRHGLTLGEILVHCFHRDGLPLGPDGALSVVTVWGWERRKTAAAWGRPFIPPSPNMPSLETALLYPGGCLVEGTNLSEGRGTSFPFRVIGAPFLDGERLAADLDAAHLTGVFSRPIAFRPSFEKHAGALCRGVMLHVTDHHSFRPVTTFLTLLTLAHAQAPEHFQFLERAYEFETKTAAFDLLTGSAQAREAISAGAHYREVTELVAPVEREDYEMLEGAEALLATAQA